MANGRACLITRKSLSYSTQKNRMERGQTNRVGYGRTLRLLDRIGPVGRFDANMVLLFSGNFTLINSMFYDFEYLPLKAFQNQGVPALKNA